MIPYIWILARLDTRKRLDFYETKKNLEQARSDCFAFYKLGDGTYNPIASDLFCLGVAMWTLATGERLFQVSHIFDYER
jgi:hypothetical protein